MLAAHKERIKDKIRKVAPLSVRRKKKYAKMLFLLKKILLEVLGKWYVQPARPKGSTDDLPLGSLSMASMKS